MIKYIQLTCYLIFSFSFHCSSGQEWKNLDADGLFQRARTTALEGNWEDSREMLQFILDKHPNYEDARILLARTYAWSGDRSTARMELRKVLEVNSKSEDGLRALIDTEIWDGDLDAALITVDRALQTYPASNEFLLKKASILNNQKKRTEAKVVLDRLLAANPTNQNALALLRSIRDEEKVYTISGSYSIDGFSRTFNPAHYGSIQLSRKNSWGMGIVRGNFANRFDAKGVQYEIDLYPRITDGVYGYLNYGYSRSSIFPTHRAGAELFSKIPKRMEVSAGVRFMNFSSTNNIVMYTGSLGIYLKNYWVSLRPYITPDKVAKTTYSIFVSVRKYWQNTDNYIAVHMGGGFSPDERRFQSGVGFSSDNIYMLQSQRGSITLQRSIRPTLLIIGTAGVIRQELIFDTGSYMYIINASLGISKKF